MSRRRWLVLGGFAGAIIVCLGVALWFDPAAFAHYRGMVAQQAIGAEFIPGLAGVFRLIVARHWFWVQFVPAILGVGWTAWFWGRHSTGWNWREHGVLVLFVSALVSPYSWLPDEIVLLPVIYLAAAWLFGGRMSKKEAAGVTVLIALNALLLVMAVVQVPLPSGAYVWSGLVWIAWYSLGRRVVNQRRAADLIGQRHETMAPAS